MWTKTNLIKLLIGFSLAIPLTILYESCSFCPRSINEMCDFLDTTQTKKLTDSSQTLVLEDPGTIAVFNGSGCSESKNSGNQTILRVKGSINLPSYATNAAVFLNGWHLKYLDSDQHVAGLATMIGDIKISNKPDGSAKVLNWQAAGIISDDNFDNPYSWCYFYTVVAWNDSNLALSIDQKDGNCDYKDHRDANFYYTDNSGTFTALSSYFSFIRNADFIPENTVAILPRGFGLAWNECGEDHHLLQVAYNLDHSEKFIEKGKRYQKKYETIKVHAANSASLFDSGYVSWNTYTIFKDNDTRRNYSFGEIISGLGGNDLEIVQPPYSILPKDGESAGTTSSNGILTLDFAVKDLPYKYVIPMLTGWNLNYLTDDQHVKDIGIWIHDVHYNFDPNAQKGILNYKISSVLADDDNFPDFFSSHKLTILGLKGIHSVRIQKRPDLIPFSPLGNDESSFCRMEDNRKLLRVTIKNQGVADAGPSKTKVIFSNSSFTLDTPPIPANSSVDLLFKVPGNCSSSDCSFKIIADSDNQINESNESNNEANGKCTR